MKEPVTSRWAWGMLSGILVQDELIQELGLPIALALGATSNVIERLSYCVKYHTKANVHALHDGPPRSIPDSQVQPVEVLEKFPYLSRKAVLQAFKILEEERYLLCVRRVRPPEHTCYDWLSSTDLNVASTPYRDSLRVTPRARAHRLSRAPRSGISKARRYDILARDNFTCTYCGRRPPDVRLTVDHVVPLARGGDEDMSNYATSCEDCNAGKSDKLPWEVSA